MGDLDVSVVIAARNEEQYIHACLSSLMDQTMPSDRYSIVVVDGMSTDATRREIERATSDAGWTLRESTGNGQEPASVCVIDNPHRTTPHAFNIGIAQSQSRYIGLFGAHATADPAYLEACLRAAEQSGASIVGGSIDIVGENDKASAIAAAQTSALGTGGGAYRTSGTSAFVDTVPFPFMRSDLVAEIGGFDEELLRNQDDEFIHRARQRGHQVWLDESISSTYISRSSLKKLWKQYFGYGRYRILTWKKRSAAGAGRQLVPIVALGVFVVVTAASLLWSLPAVPVVLVLVYAAAVGAESVRLRGLRRQPMTTFAAIVAQHASYALGQLVGIANLMRPSRDAV